MTKMESRSHEEGILRDDSAAPDGDGMPVDVAVHEDAALGDNAKPDDNAKRIQRAAYRWNSAGGMLFALQSVIMLVVLTRVCDVYVAGVFTIAFANANLFLNIGKFGMRKFQVSDRTCEFSFREYRASRIISCIAMMVASCAYIAYSTVTLGYSVEKTLVMVVMCVFKAIDAYEDVYTGAYQRENRLDIGAKMITIRMAVALAVFAVLAIALADLLWSLTLTTAFTAVFFAVQVRYVRKRYNMPAPSVMRTLRDVMQLLKECLPVFAADFLLFYMGCAPKYAIDAIMDDAAQAYYGYVAMPVFVVTLLASFIYNPMIAELTDMWLANDVKRFMSRFAKIASAIAGITAVCVAGAWAIGVPVLNVLYNAELSPYLVELLALVVGGGFLAIATLATLGITIVRFQNVLVPLYAVLAVFAFFTSNTAVSAAGITGAAWAYVAIMAAAAIVFAVTFCARVAFVSRADAN